MIKKLASFLERKFSPYFLALFFSVIYIRIIALLMGY